jgi:hypothetical protein
MARLFSDKAVTKRLATPNVVPIAGSIDQYMLMN